MRTWAEARTDCINQGGDLVSITDPFEQGFIQGADSYIATNFDLLFVHFVMFLFVFCNDVGVITGACKKKKRPTVMSRSLLRHCDITVGRGYHL